MNDDNRGRYGIVKNVYDADPGKYAAWVSAKHVEKAPKKQDPPTP